MRVNLVIDMHLFRLRLLQACALLFGIGFSAHSSRAAELTLPQELPLSFVQKEEFAEFSEDPRVQVPPFIGSSITQDGQPLSSRAQLRKLFVDRFFASVPKGSPIQTSRDSQGSPKWDYPVGTWIVHWIDWNAAPGEARLFELRAAFKTKENFWELATYLPSATQDRWILRGPDTNSSTMSHRFLPLGSPTPTEVKLRRIPQSSCRGCHMNLSPAAASLNSPDEAGPCGFVIGNPSVETSWAENYFKKNGTAAIIH